MRPFISTSLLRLCLAALLALGWTSCEKTTPEDQSFDQPALLANLANNLIRPSYEALDARVSAMADAAAAFQAQPGAASLAALQDSYREACLAWASCSAFEFGPAADRLLRTNVNTFPTDADQIEQNIAAGAYNLGSASNIDAKGFPALDYLLYGGADVLAAYQSSSTGPARMAYLGAVLADLQSLVGEVAGAWAGSYAETFIAAEGTDVGSSLGQLVNQLNYDYELLKKPKLGIPLGKQTLGTALPENVEAYYSGLSLELMRAQFDAIARLYHGGSTADVDGYGLYEALEALGAAYNGGQLSVEIETRIESVRDALAAIPGPLSETVATNPGPAEDAYNQVQRLLVLFKTDMTSALGVLITYVDNDGD